MIPPPRFDLRRLLGDQDVLLGLLAALVLAVEYVADRDLAWWQLVAGLGLAGGVGVLVALRQRYPLALLAFTDAAILARAVIPEGGDGVAWGLVALLAVYTAATHSDGLASRVGLALTVVLVVGILAYDDTNHNLGGVLFFALLGGTPWVFGRLLRRRRSREEELELARQAAEVAIVEERARIARELHDVVGHALGVIVLQAEGAGRILRDGQEEVGTALHTIASTGRDALVEMRRLVSLLRESDDASSLGPRPGLEGLDGLIDQVRRAGLPVNVVVEGNSAPLPPGVDLSAFRIVQEGLTNALKHAGPATATVVLRYRHDELEVEVVDSGAGGTSTHGGGHGLVGIRERVDIYGGTFDAGPRAGGGYVLRARLPLVRVDA
jgi:signal transduction histidine kinase